MEWNRVISKNDNQSDDISFKQVISTYDSSLLIIGDIYYPLIQKNKGIYLKVDSDGNVIWTRTIEGINNFYLNSISQTNDSGFIVTGKSSVWESRGLVEKVIVFKLNKYANFCWISEFKSDDDYKYIGFSVKQVDDTNYMVSGYSEYEGHSFLLKLSGNGSLMWAKRYYKNGAFEYCYIFDFVFNDTGLVLFGNINQVPTLIQTDSSGIIQWVKLYPDLYLDNSANLKIQTTADDGFVFVTRDDYSDGFILKTDSVGNPLFVDELVIKPIGVVETGNSEFFIVGNGPLAGITNVKSFTGEIGFIQLDSLGNGGDCVWDLSTSVENDTVLVESLSLSPVSGSTIIGSESVDVTSVDLNSRNGCVELTWGVDNNSSIKMIKVYPNPSAGKIIVSLVNGEEGQLEIYNINGQIILKKPLIKSQTAIDLTGEVPGIYFYRFINYNGNVFSGKVVLK